jgi:hypothetical protein
MPQEMPTRAASLSGSVLLSGYRRLPTWQMAAVVVAVIVGIIITLMIIISHNQ